MSITLKPASVALQSHGTLKNWNGASSAAKPGQ